MIINGKALAEKILLKLKKEIEDKKLHPVLAIVALGFNQSFYSYSRKIEREAKIIGLEIKKHLLFYHTTKEKLLEKISELNKDPNVLGILLQIPPPPQIKTDEIIKAIDPEKDVDGFHPQNLENLLKNKPTFIPPAAQAILYILSSIKIPLKNKRTVLLTRSEIFAKPVNFLLKRKGIKTDTVLLSLPNQKISQKVAEKMRKTDIVISALGSPGIIDEKHVSTETIVIDYGYTKKEKKMVGDVNFKKVSQKAKWITPVPGGIGPITAAMLLKNVVKAASRLYSK